MDMNFTAVANLIPNVYNKTDITNYAKVDTASIMKCVLDPTIYIRAFASLCKLQVLWQPIAINLYFARRVKLVVNHSPSRLSSAKFGTLRYGQGVHGGRLSSPDSS
jgi:hypothetical protein